MASVNFQKSNFSRKHSMKGRKFKSLHWGCISSMCCVFCHVLSVADLFLKSQRNLFFNLYLYCWCSYSCKFFLRSYTNEMNTKQLNMSENLNMLTSLSFTKIMNSRDMTQSYHDVFTLQTLKKTVIAFTKSIYSNGKGTGQELKESDESSIMSVV